MIARREPRLKPVKHCYHTITENGGIFPVVFIQSDTAGELLDNLTQPTRREAIVTLATELLALSVANHYPGDDFSAPHQCLTEFVGYITGKALLCRLRRSPIQLSKKSQ